MESDVIYRQQAIEAVMDEFKKNPTTAIRAKSRLEGLPPAEPREKLIAKIDVSEEQMRDVLEKIRNEPVHLIPPAEPAWIPVREPAWIPVKTRPMDEEERAYWSDHLGYDFEDEDAVIFDCKMPDDGQEILVSFEKWVSMDKCETDGDLYGLEGNGDWDGVVAWMPAPAPYRGERHERNEG